MPARQRSFTALSFRLMPKARQTIVSSTPALPAPTNLAAAPDNGFVTLTWTASAAPGAAYYEIYESSTPNAPPNSYTNIGTAYGTTFTQTGLTNGTTYSYYLIAYNNGNASPNSNVATATIGLPAPTNLVATPGNGLITLTWNSSAGSGVSSYSVFESATQNGTYTNIGYVPATSATTYSLTQTGLTNGSTYYYYVVADNNGGDSSHSAVASGTLSLPAPTGLTTTTSTDTITLSWTASAAPGAAYYQVFESTSQNGPYTQIDITTGTTYTQSGLNNTATYYYYLIPVNNGGVGTQSATASATFSLPAPTNLVTTPGNGLLTLTWNGITGSGVSSYSVFESATQNGTYTNIGYVPATSATTYSLTQTGLTNGSTYYYYVVADNNGGDSSHSAVASGTLSLPAPTGLTATTGSGSVTLSWTASAAAPARPTIRFISPRSPMRLSRRTPTSAPPPARRSRRAV